MDKFKAPKLHSAGFSLVEALLSLLVVSAILALPSHHSNQYGVALEEALFFNQVESKMNEMQLHAITSQRMSHVRFLRRGVVFQTSQQAPTAERTYIEYPPSVQLKSDSFYFDFKGGSGRTNQFKTLTFNTAKGEVSFVFQISNGRYHIRSTP